ncbi:MAG: tetratricopeptide repeat protein [Planctomycetota bacterium]
MTTPPTLETGQILSDRYRLRGLLGEGGMGQVYLADDLETGDSVALKCLQALDDATDQRRFEREIRALRRLAHPNIVALRDLGWRDDLPFFTMDYHPGVSLEEVITARGAVTESAELDWYLRLMIQVSEALACLHERHFVHRDVKPANILVRVPGLVADLPPAAEWIGFDNATALLADFGLVKIRDGDRSLTRTALGTPQYMSPEQIEASPAVDERSDLYSVGVMLYRMATGKLPFETLSSALSREPARPIRDVNSELPELLEQTIDRLLQFEPYRRPADAHEVAELLRGVLDRKLERTGADRITKLAQPSFVGRSAELHAIQKRVAEAARGDGRWVVIEGEAGTGKSWFLHRSNLKSQALIHEKVSFYAGSFTPRLPHAAFGGLVEGVLRHLERHGGPDAAVEALGSHGRLLDLFLPEHTIGDLLDRTPEIEGLSPEYRTEHIVATVVRVLTWGIELDPRMLILEDVHYATPVDIEILRRTILACLDVPALVVTTWRPEARTRIVQLEALIHEVQLEDRVTEIEMRPFTAVEVPPLVESLFLPARRVSPEFNAVLHERTDGIPLYLLHLVNSLWTRNAIELVDDTWTVDPDQVRSLPIPESTRSHFLLVLEEIPAEVLRILNLAAVIGPEFSFDLLHAVADLDEFELDRMCRDLVHTGILEERQSGYRFVHSFEQEILLGRLSGPLRQRLHARAGRTLESLHAKDTSGFVAEIGDHLYRGGELESAFDYLMRAAEKSERAYAPPVALEYFRKALDCAPAERDRRRITVRLGSLEESVGHHQAAKVAFEEAEAMFQAEVDALDGKPGALESDRLDLASYVEFLSRSGDFRGKSGDTAGALESYRRAVAVARHLGDDESLAYASMRQGSALLASEQFEEADSVLSEAVKLYELMPPTAGLVSALNGWSLTHTFRGQLDRAVQLADRALEAARAIDDRVRIAGTLSTRGTIFRRKGQLDEATASFEQAADLQEQLADRRGLAKSLGNLGSTHQLRGDYHKAESYQERARKLCRQIGDTMAFLQITGNLGSMQFDQGRFEEARETLTEYLDEFRILGVQQFIADGLVKLGTIDLECHRLEAAEAKLREGLENYRASGYESDVPAVRVQLARLHARRGEYTEAITLCREIIEERGEIEAGDHAATPTLTAAHRVLGEALLASGDPEGAEGPALEALRLAEASQLGYGEGAACQTLGQIYRELGFYWADQTEKFFARSLEAFERLQARHAIAISQLEFGVFLVLMDEIDHARELFETSLAVFEELGMEAEAERARCELKEIE